MREPKKTELQPDRCDTRVWSGECAQSDDATGKNEYLCTVCGTIRNLDHEVHHEVFPHVSGDSDNLS
jgi:hypothetical protein